MRQITLFLSTFIILFLSTGCSTTHIIQPDETLHIKKNATLFKKDFQEIDISEFYTSGDSIIVLEYAWNDLVEFSKSDVTKIVVRVNSFKGSLLGASVGVLAAVVLFKIVPEEDTDGSFGSNEDWFSFFVRFNAIIGAIGGYKEGYRDIYVFDTPESNNIKAKNEIEVIKTEPILSPAGQSE